MPANVTYPFWIVTKRLGTLSVPVVPDACPGYVAAFTTVEKAIAYAGPDGSKGYEFKMVARPTLVELADGLSPLGVKGFCFDPEGGRCGAVIDFDQFK
jgi:hypothetical protein